MADAHFFCERDQPFQIVQRLRPFMWRGRLAGILPAPGSEAS